MKFLLDNNLPPALARALNELTKAEGHSVLSLRDKFPPSTADVAWISVLREEGGWAVISQDKFTKGDIEKRAFRECGLPVFCLAKHWGNESYWNKAHNLVRWWPSIMSQAHLNGGGAAFRVPWKCPAHGKFDQIKI
ncbi:hypothetical protein LOY28_03485 [Pseudomonas sp. B21-017]|uniref:PIN-like domain-containing protein n=1 Tax=Pseudomonas sp. B21-017 TaxID=2895474 RepID=UPI00215F0DC5|nr:hypothetical protein [Pseudomonas sp. B21-017]UVM39513.1 hypothetical protein LOY28_03485 [Pseudomonas sp. B21-017]